jgi:hypothetical protein
MSIGFRLKSLEEVRAQLGKMTDAQLIEHGRTLRALCRPTKGRGIDKDCLMQLNESRAEWRKRHPSTVRETPKDR